MNMAMKSIFELTKQSLIFSFRVKDIYLKSRVWKKNKKNIALWVDYCKRYHRKYPRPVAANTQ